MDLGNSASPSYLWARTIHCPYCAGKVPLSPNWKLTPDGTGVRVLPQLGTGPGDGSRHCGFEIVARAKEQSEGTAKGGDAICPFPDCGRVIDGDNVKHQAQAGGMGEQLFAVVFKKQVITGYTKATKKKPASPKTKWERGYRGPRPEDDNSPQIAAALAEKLPEWEALDLVPNERFPEICNDDRPIQYGMPLWRDLFSPRQLLCHGTSAELFRELLTEESAKPEGLSELTRASLGYISLALDKFLNWNARLSSWNVEAQRMRSVFDRHDFAFKWSTAEMAPLITGLGYEWVLDTTAKCIGELIDLIDGRSINATDAGPLFAVTADTVVAAPVPLHISCSPGDSLAHIADASVDAVVMDPPYYDNVMYAELSDFFYVWLKRTAGLLYPELFMAPLTDKEHEAVANSSLFWGKKGAKAGPIRSLSQSLSTAAAICAALRGNRLSSRWPHHSRTTLLQSI